MDYDVVAMDLPGHGLSAQPAETATFNTFIEAVANLIQQLNAGPVHLVGISFGGMIAQLLAVEHPALVSSLSLISTAGTFSTQVRGILRDRANFTRAEGMEALTPLSLSRWFIADYSARRPDIVDGVKKLLHRQDNRFHARLWDIIADFDALPRLRELSVPALVIVGSQDRSTPVEDASALAGALGSQRLQVVQNSAHLTNLEVPETVNELLLEFLGSLVSREKN